MWRSMEEKKAFCVELTAAGPEEERRKQNGLRFIKRFISFEEGIPPSFLRMKMINTFAVAMPTESLGEFLSVSAHSSMTLCNYRQSICTSICEKALNNNKKGVSGSYLHLFSKTTHRSQTYNEACDKPSVTESNTIIFPQ